MKERDDKASWRRGIERFGAGGQVGKRQAGKKLHLPEHEGDRERFGAGGQVGEGQSGNPLSKPERH
ncbi:MAG TPA: hypothetical protein VN802_19580 [Stellaceae bacterium]|nr:hypothetical protein [Stellaceae bacterium]